MQLLADQSVHRQVVVRLREAVFDIAFILETMPGCSDEEILARADISGLPFVTGDKGFGDWIFNKRLPRPFAIILSRLPHPEWSKTADRLIDLLEQGIAPGQMVTIMIDGERRKPFPLGATNV